MCTNADEVQDFASKMLGNHLVTKQSGAEGKPVNKVFLMERLYLRRETYFSILMDRSHNGPVMVGSPDGGMSIEDVAAETPDRIFKEAIDIKTGIQDEQVMRMATNMGFSGDEKASCRDYEKVVRTFHRKMLRWWRSIHLPKLQMGTCSFVIRN